MLSRHLPNLSVISIDVTEILANFTSENSWYVYSSLSGLPSTHKVIAAHSNRTLTDYLHRRDGYRAERGDLPYWTGLHYSFTSYIWDTSPPLNPTTVTKLIFDKFWHGRNRAKGYDDPLAACCPLCTSRDSQRHQLLYCSASPQLTQYRAETFRKCCLVLSTLLSSTTIPT